MAKRNLIEAPNENVFWLADGKQVKNLRELLDTLNTLDEATFLHHVNKERNDFARWIHDILDDEELARKIWRFKSKNQLIKLIDSHLRKNYA